MGLARLNQNHLLLVLLVFAMGLCILPPAGYGQVVTASITGMVTDSSGASVPDATLTAKNVATGFETSTKSDVSGSYLIPSLAPGTYVLSARREGFRATQISGLTLEVNQQARMDVKLEVGQVTTVVQVAGSTPMVQTTTASVGTVIGEQQMTDLPLNLRRVTSLAIMVPGTVSASSIGYAAYAVGGSQFSEATYVAGSGRDSSNTLLIDGMESRSFGTGGFGLVPPPDAVQEFKIQTNVYSAEFGNTAGSTMNLVTKSGANAFHGSAYEFLRNNDLDARNFFADNQINPYTGLEIPGSARPAYRRNQFGATIGGPLQKNKTFLFGFYEGLREIKGLSLGDYVPTDAEKAGDFSSFLTGTSANLCGAGGPANLDFDTGQLFEPATESLYTCPAGSANANSTVLVGQAIPGNVITNIDHAAQKVLAAFPEADRPGFPNYVNQTPLDLRQNQFGARLDHSFGSGDRIFGRYMFGQSNSINPAASYSALPGFADSVFYRGQNIVVAWTHIFGPHLLNEASVGFQRNNPVQVPQATPRAPGFLESFDVKNLVAASPQLEQFPIFGFANFSELGDSQYRPITNVEMSENYTDNLTWSKGRHSIVFGADIHFVQTLRQQNPYSPGGQFFFDGQFTGLAGEIPNVGAISDLADLETGYPDFASRSANYRDVNQVGQAYWAWYAQDDIHVNSKLSMNLGLRYDYRRHPIDKNYNLIDFLPLGAQGAYILTDLPAAQNDALCSDPTHVNLVAADGQCLVLSSARRAQMGFTGRTQRTLVFPDYTDFAPRIGLAWRPTSSDKLVVRTGYGIFYDMGNLNTQQLVSNNPVFSPTQNFTAPFGSPPPLTNGIPTNTENVYAGELPLLSQQYAAFYLDPHFVSPRVQEWSFGIESQLAKNWGLDVSYVGSAAHNLDNIHYPGNQPVPGVGDFQPRRPYPNFNQVAYMTSDGNDNYNSLQVRLNKSYSNGLLLLTTYTWAKTLDDVEGNEGSYFVSGQLPQYEGDRAANWGRAVSDARQRMVFSPIWRLPVGSGRRYLNRKGVLNTVLGGWQSSAILSLQTGMPFSVVSASDFSNTGSPSPRPDRTCRGEGNGTISDWINANCFTTDNLQTALNSGQPRFGNSGRNILSAPSLATVDLALMKNFQLMEPLTLQFRAEGYNIFNRANFGLPDSTFGTGNFGLIGGASDARDMQFSLKLMF